MISPVHLATSHHQSLPYGDACSGLGAIVRTDLRGRLLLAYNGLFLGLGVASAYGSKADITIKPD